MMTSIFVNLKRFDIPSEVGGLCPEKDSASWARNIIDATIAHGLHARKDLRIIYFFPQSLIIPAREALFAAALKSREKVTLGSQGVFREDVVPGGNFGAFTTNFPAKAAAALGCEWALIGHSEERKDKFDILFAYDDKIMHEDASMTRASHAIQRLINAEVLRAFEAGLNVLYCVGETAGERGEGSFEEQKPRVEAVLASQLELGLDGIAKSRGDRELAIGYEPRWAIGPGRTAPDPGYISFVSAYIKQKSKEILGYSPAVVYGGGLKTENARAIAGVSTSDGGLVALTKFTPPIAFSLEGLENILDEYLAP